MSFVFYPRLEQSCPNVSHCPHLGGAALGRLVSVANENGEIKRCQEPILLTAYLKMRRLRKWEDQNEPLRVVGFTTF